MHNHELPSSETTFTARFKDYLGVPVDSQGHAETPEPGALCRMCCHWALPLTMGPRNTQFGVAMTYVEWIVWHWHIQQHQLGVPLS